MLLKYIKIRRYEMGLVFHDREFRGLLATGAHWLVALLGKTRVSPQLPDKSNRGSSAASPNRTRSNRPTRTAEQRRVP